MLHAHEVFSRWESSGECELHVGDALGSGIGHASPDNALGGPELLHPQRIHLEPIPVAQVVLRRHTRRCLGHVHVHRPRVAHDITDVEADGVAGVDDGGLGGGAVGGVEAADVADHVFVLDVGEGGVGVGGAAHEFIFAGGDAVDDEAVEVVVGRDSGGGER